MAGALTLEWFGCTTFRLQVDGLTIWLDTFLDRVAAAPAVGLTVAEVTEADFVFISHCHFDHILGANVVARNTGANIVGSYEAMRLMNEGGVPAAQQWPVSGGEVVDCGHGVTVSVYPSIHSCLFAANDPDSGGCCLGDLGVSLQERRARMDPLFTLMRDPDVMDPELFGYMNHPIGPISDLDGGQLIYLITTPYGSILWSASSGCWTPILRQLRPDVALLAVAGRPNVDGEPFQGTMAEFIVRQVEMLRPRTVIFCHHDAFLPPFMNGTNVEAAAAALGDRTPWAQLVTLRYGDPVAILG
ncbi:MAG TPA: MBL fold metallo-hydrolase [Acidimicrobiales bacterium]|jgi:L-ascorbate metabolism protein UlaG (beta-lactamase superfamily)|nr:MBL fold metallo-hydrolase [Acidimicrobiales bacterium]